MLGSQALDVLIGIALAMSIVSLAASTIVEMISGWLKWRARMLESAICHLVLGKGGADGADVSKTAVIDTLAGPDRRFPSYVSSAAFVDAVSELAQQHEVPPGIEARLRPAAKRGETVHELRARLERHFDETMERVSGAYKRRAMLWLFLVGLAIAVIGNVSVFHIGRSLWSDTTTREAVVEAARNVDPEGIDASDLESVGATVSQLEDVGIPVGWTEEAKADWGKTRTFPWTRVGMMIGWLLTAVLVTLGAPFWFDLLTRLVSLRSSGKKPAQTTAAPETVTPADMTPISRGEAPDPELRIKQALGAA